MRKRIGLTCMGVGTVLLAAALSLLLYNRAEDKNAGNAAQDIMPAVIAAIETSGDSDLDSDIKEAGPDMMLTENDENTEMAVTEIDGYGYIGYLSIPVLELELPVMSEWDYTRLKIAPCRYSGSTRTDDLVICAHNYTRHFGTLKNLQAGDLVSFTDMDGVTITYKVVEIETLQPAQVSELVESDYDLTLFTCTYGGKARVTVRCDRTEGK